MKNTFLFLLLASLTLLPDMAAKAQDQGFIYGEIEMVNGDKFFGQIRWGDEEAFWTDIFNSQKVDNPFLKNLDRQKMRSYKDSEKSKRDYTFMSIWTDNTWNYSANHQFAIRFGDMKSLKVRGDQYVIVTFKNNETIELRGGSNDIGVDLKVYDQEIGQIELDWDRISEVRFKEAPSKIQRKMGEPLFAKVKTFRKGEFEGFIQWDHDECLSTDKLDGSSRNGKVAIEFGNIRSIKSDKRGSTVILKSGREMYLDDSNDVDSGNRGIVVKSNEYGRVLISWKEFDSIEFADVMPGSGTAYDQFPATSYLKGSVKTVDGKEFLGQLVFDLDEFLNVEILDGNDDGLEYKIPFYLIKKIVPRNHSYTKVILTSGKELLLGDSQDVNDRNDGMLIKKGPKDDDGDYVKWEDVESITFDWK